MLEETFVKLQRSEGIICHMASRLLAAYISSGQLTESNEDELVERSVALALKLAYKADRAIDSDEESSGN